MRGNTGTSNTEGKKQEHILVCLSSSPTNERLIRKAAGLSEVYGGYFTALYIETPGDRKQSEDDRRRLENNERLARKLGARLEIIHGENIPFQIAEYVRVSDVTKIVIGRSTEEAHLRHGKGKLVDALIAYAPDVDIYIIPDRMHQVRARVRTHLLLNNENRVSDFFFTLAMLGLCSLIGWCFKLLNGAESNIVVFYIFFVFLISVRTANWVYSVCAAGLSVVIYNFLFTKPEFTLRAYDNRYTVAFAVMFLIALLTGTMAARLKIQAQNASRMAFRLQVLYDMNQLMEKCRNQDEIKEVTARQLVRLLHRNVLLYRDKDKNCSDPEVFLADTAGELSFTTESVREAAEWTFKNGTKSGNGTRHYSDAGGIFFAIRLHDVVYGVIGVDVRKNRFDPYEESIVIAILGEAAIALENKRNEAEKELARVMARNKQLRANLLRSISHDLRTPLTSIAGTASLLMADADKMDDNSRNQMYSNIYEDAMWLEDLVENLLSITRLKEGQTKIHTSVEFVSEVIEEACRHCNRKLSEHKFTVGQSSDILLGRMDAHLIIQVLVNLVNNAVKYTPQGSEISVYAEQIKDMIQISVSDNGPGVAQKDVPHIFDMFYSGTKTVADSSRSLGLGLALCQEIVQAHGGRIWYEQNVPHGSIFRFTIPAQEVHTDA
ncbi:MAG: DUF4118 domain-containing protein [Eubacterium sp.]|nr:DUF4118 domain-containing protein [Eubacterium sp.]